VGLVVAARIGARVGFEADRVAIGSEPKHASIPGLGGSDRLPRRSLGHVVTTPDNTGACRIKRLLQFTKYNLLTGA
jgi:hypothetical protein